MVEGTREARKFGNKMQWQTSWRAVFCLHMRPLKEIRSMKRIFFPAHFPILIHRNW